MEVNMEHDCDTVCMKKRLLVIMFVLNIPLGAQDGGGAGGVTAPRRTEPELYMYYFSPNYTQSVIM